MSLPDAGLDPFGMWQPPPEGDAEPVSFEIPAEALDNPTAVWRLDLSEGYALAERARQVAALQTGLLQAEERLSDLLVARRGAQASGSASFGLDAPVAGDGAAEQRLTNLLNELDPQAPVSFGLIQEIGAAVRQVTGTVKEMGGLSAALHDLEAMLNQFNRQFLHYAWVETTISGTLVARTTVNWVGDMTTYCQPGLAAEVEQAHQRSVQLALAARAGSFKTILTILRMAAALALAVSTPIGLLQGMALGWQFVRDVIQPLLRAVQSQAASGGLAVATNR